MTDFNQYLKNAASEVSARLDTLMSRRASSVVTEAMKYSLGGTGKRIRPFITLEFSKLCGGSLEAALDFGCAVEMIHTYSLIHDDLPCMDNDDLRRGKPSCRIAFGEDNALLAGDALLTEAFSVLANAQNVCDKNKVKAVGFLSELAGVDGMVGGQVLDLAFESGAPSLDEIYSMYSLKTCALIKASAVLGCLSFDGCDEKMIQAAGDYAYNLGMAFQIVDDILDVTGNQELLGKPVGSDDKNDKSTALKYLGLDGAKDAAVKLTNKAVEALNGFDGDSEALKELAFAMADRKF